MEISPFTTDGFAEIYQLWVRQHAEKHIFFRNSDSINFLVNQFKTEWVTGIENDEQREAEIQSCFSNKVEIHLATEPDDLVSLIEKFKLRTRDITHNESNSVWRKNFNGLSYCYGRRLGYC